MDDSYELFCSEAAQDDRWTPERSVLPYTVRPSIVACLWWCIGILIFSGVQVWGAEMPVYASASAEIFPSPSARTTMAHPEVVGVVPVEHQAQLRVGQIMVVQVAPGQELRCSIVAIDPLRDISGGVQERLPGAIAQALELQHPAVVVRARLEAAPAGFDPVAFSGRTYPGAVIVATRRLVPFLPSIIQLLQR